MKVDIERLQSLIAEATPQPWRFVYNKIESKPRADAVDALAQGGASDAKLDAMPEFIVAYVDTAHGDTPSPMGQRDGALIADGIAALPQLLEIAKAAFDLMDVANDEHVWNETRLQLRQRLYAAVEKAR